MKVDRPLASVFTAVVTAKVPAAASSCVGYMAIDHPLIGAIPTFTPSVPSMPYTCTYCVVTANGKLTVVPAPAVATAIYRTSPVCVKAPGIAACGSRITL